MYQGGFVPWNKYWEKKYTVDVPERGSFNTYANFCGSSYFVVCVHGAGHSALSFSLLADNLKGVLSVCALDLKCHGDTAGDVTKDLEIGSMVEDVAGFCKVVQPKDTHLILVGHSMGGAIAARVCHVIHASVLIVVDTIEQIALENMGGMKQMLLERPQAFASPGDAIDYIATSGELQNFESAAVSAQGRFTKGEDGLLHWKVDFLKCEKDWNGWFVGFADAYLTATAYKVLVVPDINRLDTPFTIGHMSGKFQLVVILETNHCVHEDKPKEFAEMMIKLVKRIGPSHQWD